MNRMKMKTETLPAEGEAIAKAADLLRRGELVALPTETVYGIAADARNGAAVAKIFVAKVRCSLRGSAPYSGQRMTSSATRSVSCS